MFNRLEEIIKKVEGNVLVVELNDNLLMKFDKNNKVNLYSITSNKKSTKGIKTTKMINNHGKKINIKHLRRYINKKSVDYIICNMDNMLEYYKYFIKDSIYLNNKKIYIYFTNNIDKNFVIDRYKRYNVDIKLTEYKTGCIIEIDNKNGKNNFLKDKFYFIKDTFYNLAEFIGNILIN